MRDISEEIKLNILSSFVNCQIWAELDENGDLERHENIYFSGFVVDYSMEGSKFQGAGCYLSIAPSETGAFGGRINIEAGLKALAGSTPEEMLGGGYPPIMGELAIPNDVYEQIKEPALYSTLPEGWYHSFMLHLPLPQNALQAIASEDLSSWRPVPLSAINLAEGISLLGCTGINYSRSKG